MGEKMLQMTSLNILWKKYRIILLTVLLILVCLLGSILIKRDNKQGLFKNDDETWSYYQNGKVATHYTNLIQYNGGWYYIKNGQLDWTETTFAQVDGKGDWFRVENNRIPWGSFGPIEEDGKIYYLKNARLDPNGLEITQSGYRYDENSGSLYYGLSCRNQYGNRGFRYTELVIFIRNQEGKLLKYIEHGGRYAGLRSGEAFACGGEIFLGEEPKEVIFYMSGGEETADKELLRHPQSKDFVVEDAKLAFDEDGRVILSGRVESRSSVDAEQVYVTVLLKKEDEIIGGFTGIIRDLKAEEKQNFQFTSYGKVSEYDKAEIRLTSW